MKYTEFKIGRLAAPLLPLILLAFFQLGCASAEKVEPTPRPPEAAMNQPQSMDGRIKRFLLNPRGDVDGLLLESGIQVNFPPHRSTELTKAAKVGDSVRITGPKMEYHVRAEAIMNIATGVEVLAGPPPMDHSQDPEMAAHHPTPKGPSTRPMSAKGTIENVLHGPEGELRGVILSDKTIVNFTKKVVDSTDINFEVGQSLFASGPGTQNKFGKMINANVVRRN